MLGYIKCSQWHSLNVKHVTEITDPGKHKGDGSVVDQVCGFTSPLITEDPPNVFIGEVCFIVEDDGTLTFYRSNYDSSG